MRFGEFVEKSGLAISPVDQFAGFFVQVGVPPTWEPLESALGLRVWVCLSDPRIDDFCANAVLTMHRVDAALDADEVFAMLAEQQVQSVPECREMRREQAAATEGTGVVGVLATQITHELGTIDSVSRARIMTAENKTLIAQLTVTALHESPVNGANTWLTVRKGTAAGSASVGRYSGVPVAGTREAH